MEHFQLGAFLRQERLKRQLSIRELAIRTQKGDDKPVSASYISKIETGKVYPTFQMLQKIVAALELPLVIVLDGSKALPDAVIVLSTPEIVQILMQAPSRQELARLLLICQQLTDQQLELLLSIANFYRQ